MMHFFQNWATATLQLLLESSSWLVVGFLVAGMLEAFGFSSFARKYLMRPGLGSILSASAIGIPLPLCSCSVIPVGVALRRKGASPGATASFFISTPQVGVDSFMLTVALLGAPFALMRILVSFCSAVVAGLLVERAPQLSKPQQDLASFEEERRPQRLAERLRAGSNGLWRMVEDLRIYLIIGFLLAGFFAALLPADLLSSFSDSYWLSYVVAIVIGVPTYVCATASTPLAAILAMKGVSAGAILVFLLVGPATNIATVLAFQKELGLRACCLYIGGIVFVASGAGILLDLWAPSFVAAESLAHEAHGDALSWFGLCALLYLLFPRTQNRSCSAAAPKDSSAAAAKDSVVRADAAKQCCGE